MDELNNEKLFSNIKDAVGRLRSSIDAAFSDNMDVCGESAAVSTEKKLRQMLNITQHLLQEKEKQAEDTAVALRLCNASLFRLAHILAAAVVRLPDVDNIIKESAYILFADNAILWSQRGKNSDISTVNISKEDGKALFLQILPKLAEKNQTSAKFCSDGKHYMVFSHTARNSAGVPTDNIAAAVFARDISKLPFTDDEHKLGTIMSDVIFALNSKSKG